MNLEFLNDFNAFPFIVLTLFLIFLVLLTMDDSAGKRVVKTSKKKASKVKSAKYYKKGSKELVFYDDKPITLGKSKDKYHLKDMESVSVRDNTTDIVFGFPIVDNYKEYNYSSVKKEKVEDEIIEEVDDTKDVVENKIALLEQKARDNTELDDTFIKSQTAVKIANPLEDLMNETIKKDDSVVDTRDEHKESVNLEIDNEIEKKTAKKDRKKLTDLFKKKYNYPSIDLVSESVDFKNSYSYLSGDTTIVVGKSNKDKYIYYKIKDMPNLVVCGKDKKKDAFINSILCDLLLTSSAEELRLIIYDSNNKYDNYNEICHLLTPIVRERNEFLNVLKSLYNEFERRTKLYEIADALNYNEYNNIASKNNLEVLPRIVVLIDDYSDICKNENIIDIFSSLTDLGEKYGIHFITIIEEPKDDMIDDLIKSYLPTGISFRLDSLRMSNYMLGKSGAEDLSSGHILYKNDDKVKELEVVTISDADIESIVTYIMRNNKKVVNTNFVVTKEKDELYDDVLKYLKNKETISISKLQKEFNIGFERAQDIFDDLEKDGYIGPKDGNKARKVIK